MNADARSRMPLRLECSRIVLFGLLLMSAFLSSMVHLSPEAAFDSPAAQHSSAPAQHTPHTASKR